MRFWISWLVLVVAAPSFAPPDEMREKLRDVRILFIQGFMPPRERMAVIGMGDAEQKVVTFLRQMGLDAELSQALPNVSIERSWRIIAQEIAQSNKKVLAIGYSLGGNKLLHALVENEDAASNLFGAMFVLSPLYGTHGLELMRQIRDDAHEAAINLFEMIHGPWLQVFDPHGGRGVAYAGGRAFHRVMARAGERRAMHFFHGGDPEVLEELLPSRAFDYVAENWQRIELLSQRFPILSVTASGSRLLPNPIGALLSLHHYANDAAIETYSQDLGHALRDTHFMGQATLFRDQHHVGAVYWPRRNSYVWSQCLWQVINMAHR